MLILMRPRTLVTGVATAEHAWINPAFWPMGPEPYGPLEGLKLPLRMYTVHIVHVGTAPVGGCFFSLPVLHGATYVPHGVHAGCSLCGWLSSATVACDMMAGTIMMAGQTSRCCC